MIFTDSRYSDGFIARVYDKRRNAYNASVFREFPEDSSTYYYYSWVEGDRLDIVANKMLGSASLWWKLLDFNPEIIDGFDIPTGTIIRIPNGL